MSTEELEELGPIDYEVFEWQGEQPDAGEIQPLLLDLVDRGVVRMLDIAFVAKDPDGAVSGIELGDLKQTSAAFAEFEGASSACWATTTSRRPPRPWILVRRPP